MPSEAQDAMLRHWAQTNHPVQPEQPSIRDTPQQQPQWHAARPCWWMFTITLLITAISIGLATMLYHSHVGNKCSDADCWRILSALQSLKGFPLPFTIDEKAHGDVLEEHHDQEAFKCLIQRRSEVYSTLANTAEKFVSFITRATQIYTGSSSEYTNDDFHGDIQIILEHLSRAEFSVSQLANLYDTVRSAYYTHDATTAKALQDGQLSDSQEWWSCGKAHFLPLVGGFDPNIEYLAPLEEKERKSEEARLAVITWERDKQRLEQILRGT